MTQTRIFRRISGGVITGALVLTAGAARADTKDFVDFEAGVGYSSNPGFRLDNESSAYGRISASGVHTWTTETSSTSLHAYLENTSYLSNYGSKQLFALGANTAQQLSQTVTVYGDVGFSGDFGGQLSSRLLDVPNQPPVDPDNPLPPPSVIPDQFGLTTRQYRASVNVGASIRAGERSTIGLTAGGTRAFSSGSNDDADYTSYSGSGSFSQQVSERMNAGVRLALGHQDFNHGDSTTSISPSLIASLKLSEELSAQGSIGVIRVEEESGSFKDHSTSIAFSGSMCNQGTVSRLCGTISRDAQTALSSGVFDDRAHATITTSASLTYSRQVGAQGSLQASLSGARYRTPTSFDGDTLDSSYVSATVGYDRPIRRRLYAGAQGGARKLFQSGPDPKPDFSATLYLRYRLGDLQ